jgi:hypothetical protein
MELRMSFAPRILRSSGAQLSQYSRSNKIMIPPPMTDVPPGQVGQVVQDFIDFDQVKQLEVNQQANGNFTVTPVR